MGLSDRERRVCEAVAARRSALADDLRLHVGLATGGGNAEGLDRTRELLTGRARALGARVEIAPGDERPGWLWGGREGSAADAALPIAVCRRESAGPGRPVLIAGHLDTVHDPRGAFRELTISADGKRGMGPGCVDMKGGLVIGIAALECLEACGVRVPWTLLLNSDEETGSYASARVIAAEASRVAAAGGVGIALEPAGGGERGELIVERAGSGQFMIEVRGRAAHVGRDFASGVSAVNVLAEIVVKSAAAREAGCIVNIGPLEGGIATNVVPDRARAWGNVRFGTREQAAGLEEMLRRIVAEAVRAHPGASGEVVTSFSRPAKPLTAEVQRLAEQARAVSETLGRPLPFGRTAGVCDGNIMQEAGLPTLDTLGVRGGGLHTTDEWIEMESLVERCQLLAVLVMRAAEAAG